MVASPLIIKSLSVGEVRFHTIGIKLSSFSCGGASRVVGFSRLSVRDRHVRLATPRIRNEPIN